MISFGWGVLLLLVVFLLMAVSIWINESGKDES